MAHFHGPAAAGVNAPPIITMKTLPSPIKGTATLTDAQIDDLKAGNWYFNVHTAAHPPGEIRGQLSASLIHWAGLDDAIWQAFAETVGQISPCRWPCGGYPGSSACDEIAHRDEAISSPIGGNKLRRRQLASDLPIGDARPRTCIIDTGTIDTPSSAATGCVDEMCGTTWPMIGSKPAFSTCLDSCDAERRSDLPGTAKTDRPSIVESDLFESGSVALQKGDHHRLLLRAGPTSASLLQPRLAAETPARRAFRLASGQ